MSDDNQRSGSIFRSRAGLALIAFLAVGGFLLAYDYRAHLFGDNGWFGDSGLLIALFAGCILMHVFMHRGHGGGDKDRHGGDR